jgi:phage-related holin
MVVVFLGSTEGLSVLENLAKLGAPIPKKLIEKLEIFKQ